MQSCACADALVAGTELATKQPPNPASNDLLDEDMAPLKRAVPSRAGRKPLNLTGPLPITDGIVQFAGEREMWASFQDANLRKRRRVKMMVGGAALLVCAHLSAVILQTMIFRTVCRTQLHWSTGSALPTYGIKQHLVFGVCVRVCVWRGTDGMQLQVWVAC